MNRRTFLKATGMGSATLALSAGFGSKLLATEKPGAAGPKEMPTRTLGKTGVPVSILGMGGSIDAAGYLTLLRIGLNKGITYWDSAHNYGNGQNEKVIGRFFVKYPEERKRVFQVTKASRTTDPDGMSEQLNLSLERMQTDYIDLYFIHMLQDPTLLTPEVKAWAERKKKEGKIRFFGFSCHAGMARMLKHASSLGWIDAIMASYNFQLMKDADMQKAIDACARAGVGLIAMKTQGQRLGPPPGMQAANAAPESEDLSALKHFIDNGYTPEQAKLKAVWEDERISVCLSEMTNLTMLRDNVAAATDGVKLSAKDKRMLDRLAQNSRGLYCSGCLRCESVMGAAAGIPDVLRYMMYHHSYGKRDDARRLFRELPEAVKQDLASKDYATAERACPQQIQIGSAMREAARLLS